MAEPSDPNTFFAIVAWSASISTAVATAASALAAFIWRRNDRKSVDWVWYGEHSMWPSVDSRGGEPALADSNGSFRLANSGDGEAFKVSVSGRGCRISMKTPAEFNGAFSARGNIPLKVTFPPGEDVYVSLTADPRLWSVASVLISWTQSPTWKKSSLRTISIPLSEIVDCPAHEGRSIESLTENDLKELELPPLTSEELDLLSDGPASESSKRRLFGRS